jgi:hypothetical protein
VRRAIVIEQEALNGRLGVVEIPVQDGADRQREQRAESSQRPRRGSGTDPRSSVSFFPCSGSGFASSLG